MVPTRAAKIGTVQIGVFHVGVVQIGIGQVCFLVEPGPAQIGAGVSLAGWTRAGKIYALQADSLQVDNRQIDIGYELRLAEESHHEGAPDAIEPKKYCQGPSACDHADATV